MSDGQLYVRTPLIESLVLSKKAGCNVYLKLENTQPTDSFKVRGISHRIQKALKGGQTSIVSSSGGNAGLAAAYVARQLGIPATICVPGSASEEMRDRLRQEGAKVEVVGSVWNHANDRALDIAQDPSVAFIHPFDHPDIWEGHASLIREVAEDLPGKPDVILTSVGGGGLLCGIVAGLDEVGWQDVPVIGMETVGADCLNLATKAGEIITMPDITSIAKCLGALTVAEKAFQYYQDGRVISEVITDRQCVEACLKFADDHRILVEPACGAALAAIYSSIIDQLVKTGRLQPPKTIVAVVCGGHNVRLQVLQEWKKEFDL